MFWRSVFIVLIVVLNQILFSKKNSEQDKSYRNVIQSNGNLLKVKDNQDDCVMSTISIRVLNTTWNCNFTEYLKYGTVGNSQRPDIVLANIQGNKTLGHKPMWVANNVLP